MSVTIKNRYLVIGVIILILGLFFSGWILGTSKARKAAHEAESALKFELSQKTIELNKKTIYLTQAEQALATQRELVRAGIIERETLRKLNIKHINEINRLNLQIDTLLQNVDHTGQIITVQQQVIDSLTHITTTVKKNALLLPFSFSKVDEFLNLKGDFDDNGKLGIALKMKVDISVVTGIEKKTKKPTCVLYTNNSYIETLGLASFKADTQKPKRFGIGIVGGYGLIFGDPIKTAPYLGAGISYNFIHF